MEVNIEYANKIVPIHIPEGVQLTELKANPLPNAAPLADTIIDAFKNPIGTETLSRTLHLKQPKSISIAVPNDIDPMQVKDILSYLSGCIHKALPLLPPSSVKIIFGNRHHSLLHENNYNHILTSDLDYDYDIEIHNPSTVEMINIRTTRFGTPVQLNKLFAETEFKICIGQILPHQIIGFTGASEEVTIGCSSIETINNSLSLMMDDKTCMGQTDGNRVREDLNEISRIIGLDFAIDIVMNQDQKIVQLFTGHPELTLQQGSKFCAEAYGIEIKKKFDIVIACCGVQSENKKNFQREKQLNLISQMIQKGGKAILLTASQLGLGRDIYFDHVCQKIDPDEVMVNFKQLERQMGSLNAYLFGRMGTNYDLDLSSDFDPKILNHCHLRAADISTIIKDWVDNLGKLPRLAILSNTNFYIK